MATYDGAPFLQAQLASLDAQTRRPDELVLSDDGSRDDTLEIARSFAATASFPVRILEGPQRGLAENFWFATSAAQGQLIAWSDQDDGGGEPCVLVRSGAGAAWDDAVRRRHEIVGAHHVHRAPASVLVDLPERVVGDDAGGQLCGR